MPHISLRIGTVEGDPRGARLLVDGVDITKAVLAEGFAIDIRHDPVPHAIVSMQLRVDALDMELPDAVLNLIDAEV